jgi:hypothetical protein
LVESFEKFLEEKALKEKPFFARNLVLVIHKKRIERFTKSKIETNFYSR